MFCGCGSLEEVSFEDNHLVQIDEEAFASTRVCSIRNAGAVVKGEAGSFSLEFCHCLIILSKGVGDEKRQKKDEFYEGKCEDVSVFSRAINDFSELIRFV